MFEIKSAKLHSNYILGRVKKFHFRTHWTSLTRSMTSSSIWWDLQWLASFKNVIIRVDWIAITIVNLYHISSAGRQPSVGFRRGWRPPVQTRFFSFSKSSEELFSCFFSLFYYICYSGLWSSSLSTYQNLNAVSCNTVKWHYATHKLA